MRKRRAILHIGAEGTGTAAIQAMLAAGRETLRGLGYAVARAPGETDHAALARLAAGDEAAAQGGEIAAALEAEVAGLPDAVHSVILSSDAFHGALPGIEPLARLKILLDRLFEDYRIIAYLPRQDALFLARYAARIRVGESPEAMLPAADPLGDYATMLDAWGGVFGRQGLTPRLHQPGDLAGGDIRTDFLAAAGIEGFTPGAVPPDAAPLQPGLPLAAPALEMLRRYNARPAEEAAAPPPSWLLDVLLGRFPGPGPLPTRAEVDAFLAGFGAANERVRLAHFPGRALLFDRDLSAYPEAVDPVTEAAVLDVAMAILARATELQGTRRGGNRSAEDQDDEAEDAGEARQARRAGKAGKPDGAASPEARQAKRAARQGKGGEGKGREGKTREGKSREGKSEERKARRAAARDGERPAAAKDGRGGAGEDREARRAARKEARGAARGGKDAVGAG